MNESRLLLETNNQREILSAFIHLKKHFYTEEKTILWERLLMFVWTKPVMVFHLCLLMNEWFIAVLWLWTLWDLLEYCRDHLFMMNTYTHVQRYDLMYNYFIKINKYTG